MSTELWHHSIAAIMTYHYTNYGQVVYETYSRDPSGLSQRESSVYPNSPPYRTECKCRKDGVAFLRARKYDVDAAEKMLRTGLHGRQMGGGSNSKQCVGMLSVCIVDVCDVSIGLRSVCVTSVVERSSSSSVNSECSREC